MSIRFWVLTFDKDFQTIPIYVSLKEISKITLDLKFCFKVLLQWKKSLRLLQSFGKNLSCHPLREKSNNTELFLVRIFSYLDWIRTRKYGPEKTPYMDTSGSDLFNKCAKYSENCVWKSVWSGGNTAIFGRFCDVLN